MVVFWDIFSQWRTHLKKIRLEFFFIQIVVNQKQKKNDKKYAGWASSTLSVGKGGGLTSAQLRGESLMKYCRSAETISKKTTVF